MNWSISFFYESENINLFYVILHRIGHSLDLNHVMNPNSIMIPALSNDYVFKNLDTDFYYNYTTDIIFSNIPLSNNYLINYKIFIKIH
jgi:hypothetical protein